MNNILWDNKLKILDFAFQPIICANSGEIYGVEALLRNSLEAGFKNIGDVFDSAYKDGSLYTLDLMLREKAIQKFKKLKFHKSIKIFYNLDNRLLEMPNFSMGKTEILLKENKIEKSSLCFEISEKYKLNKIEDINDMLSVYKSEGYIIALDDFGSGFSNLQKLYHFDINLLKIDRFFIKNVGKSSKKRIFLNNIINLVHTLGGLVVAEGIETEEEMHVCRMLGCDLLQGYYIQHPSQNLDDIKVLYHHVKENIIKQENFLGEDRNIIESHILKIEGTYIENHMDKILEVLKKNSHAEVFPILDQDKRVLGMIREKKIKRYLLAPFGNEFLKKKTVRDLMDIAIIADINVNVNRLIEILSLNDEVEFIIITCDGKYKGYLDKNAVIKIISEKKIGEAKNQNPLTRLPGNTQISDFIEKTLLDKANGYIYTYFDFNNFKSYNDKYGFKKGDKIITLFSEILKDEEKDENSFIGHVGGDDFFLGIRQRPNKNFNDTLDKITSIADMFKTQARDHYDQKDLKKGFILSQDRSGQLRKVPLITVSAAILEIIPGERNCTIEDVSDLLFKLKKNSKIAKDSTCCSTILPYKQFF
ncbi:GGDEF domain-containing protein [Ilyobacter polytropus]|uniref:Diguanylate cyclase/phosphodiesterase n=1 Tax=Ilyobacter polytropus (strain ATCC 51220 / DSM 2926 / LMG 16218 / CuHBu1) TaxID=572544 RepID=E3H9F2_ILYPC|nr:GGDEF domain-containing protein [Ilyobacter polytropus]ADO83061.1 diguanylate cyclase/phosphodiesterase [Ilyobacter polytropus DSM 2926]